MKDEFLRAEANLRVRALLVERFGETVRGRAEARLFCYQIAERCGLEFRNWPRGGRFPEAEPGNSVPFAVLVAFELALLDEIEALRLFERDFERDDRWKEEVKRRARQEERERRGPSIKIEIGGIDEK